MVNLAIESGLDIYKQSPSLLFQFIINDFLNTSKEAAVIEKVYRKIERSIIKDRLLAKVNDYLTQLEESFSLLIGSHLTSDKSTPWGQEQGYLSKLHEYCYLFNSQKNFNLRASDNLNACINEAYHSSMQSRDTIVSILQHQGKQDEEKTPIPDYASLYKLLDDFLDNLQRASRLILQIIIACQEDENILFFLLKNQKRLKSCYPNFSLSKLFNRMFTDGVREAKTFLVTRYAERGFKDIVEEITFLSAKLEKLAPE